MERTVRADGSSAGGSGAVISRPALSAVQIRLGRSLPPVRPFSTRPAPLLAFIQRSTPVVGRPYSACPSPSSSEYAHTSIPGRQRHALHRHRPSAVKTSSRLPS